MGIHGDNCKCGSHDQVTQSSCTVGNARVIGTPPTETTFPRTIKVPVTLAETAVVVCVEANVHLEMPALEIIRVLKSVILEQCELVPTFNPLSAKLFVSGLIRKNIEYTTVDQVSDTAVCGDVRHTTALVPFDFCTDLTFPAGGPTLQLAPDFESHGEYLNKSGHAAKINVGLFGNRKVYNERPYCELLFTEFTELDIGLVNKKCKDTTKTFSTVREKIVLRIGLKVLQNQQVPIPTTPPPKPTPPPTKPPEPCNKKW
ncbi:CsxC family protein [Brevibacillus sp. 179-C9.3 HS]|uniref:CsxC family protein n=1 Tax=unclassified Brevibacillus TaxID=2684853 RepID=UPI0039A0911C